MISRIPVARCFVLLAAALLALSGCTTVQLEPGSPTASQAAQSTEDPLVQLLRQQSPPRAATTNLSPSVSRRATPPPVSRAAAKANGRLLRAGDVLEMRVFLEEDLHTKAEVSRDGSIRVPLLGEVSVGGVSLEEARLRIQNLLLDGYLVDPQVTLTVVDFAKKRFCVMGQVNQPGFFTIPDDGRLTLLQAVSMAGGFTSAARTSDVTIRRVANGHESVVRINAEAMAKDPKVPMLEVQAEDVIQVPEKRI